MSSIRVVGGLSLALSVWALAACGGGSSPAQPAPVNTATPAPQPTPALQPLSVIPSCRLPASNPGDSAACNKNNARLGDAVNAALDRVLRERPDLFDLNDVNGGPRIVKYDAYMTAVVAAIGEAGLCGRVDPEGEIGIKEDNSHSEQWILWSSSSYVRRKYVLACSPATF
jgi:hypothetical protein